MYVSVKNISPQDLFKTIMVYFSENFSEVSHIINIYDDDKWDFKLSLSYFESLTNVT